MGLEVTEMGLGDWLKEEREKQGYTLEDAEEETKIRKRYLQAIEEEEYDVLPPRVYAVGFVKRYAKFLNLDERVVAEEFKLRAFGPDEDLDELTEPIRERRTFNFPWKNFLAAAVFLVVAIWAGSFVVPWISERSTPPPKNEPPPSVQAPQKGPDNDNLPTPPAEQRQAEVVIKARQNCWLRVLVDGEPAFEAILPSGQEKSFVGKEKVYVKAGNAGGIDITFNGKKVPPLGTGAEVKEREFKVQP